MKMEGINEATTDTEYPLNDPLVHSMREELGNLSTLSPRRCIYRVPERLRRGNEESYTPKVISIGPLHHGKGHLNPMEEHKMRYLRDFIDLNQVSLEYCVNKIREQEAMLCNCYAEDIKFSSDDFVRIILVDAAFIIEFLMRYWSPEFRDENDYIFGKPWMVYDVLPDLWMLENQLPFFILKELFDPAKYFPDPAKYFPFTDKPSLFFLSSSVFKTAIYKAGIDNDLDRISSEVEVKHFVDLIRNLCLPLKSRTGGKLEPIKAPSMTELHQAGVKFQVRSGKNLLDIQFSNGILEIPRLKIGDRSESTIRNLVALEQCHYEGSDRYISNYITLLDRLVNTPKDVELLVEHGILYMLGDNKKVSTLINSLGDGVRQDHGHFFFANVCEDLNKHCQAPMNIWKAHWNIWKAILRQNYLNTPWSIISIVAAVILLLLTLIQTVCSVISVS